jgi:hypothetical protein
VQGPTINHEGLRKRLKAAEDYLKNASAHVTNFLRTIEQAKADGTINEQLLNELAGLQDSILRLVRNNEEIAQFMFKELYGLSDYQALLMQVGAGRELIRLNQDLSKKFKIRFLNKMPMEQRMDQMGKSATIKQTKEAMEANAVQAEVRSNRMNYQQLLSKLEEAREILGRQLNLDPTPPPTPRAYHPDNF